jgi:hypothetical protein
VNSAYTYTPADVDAAETWTGFQLTAWGLTPHLVGEWLAEATACMEPEQTARVELTYQEHEQLLSFDVWVIDRHVYGVDHLCGSRARPVLDALYRRRTARRPTRSKGGFETDPAF